MSVASGKEIPTSSSHTAKGLRQATRHSEVDARKILLPNQHLYQVMTMGGLIKILCFLWHLISLEEWGFEGTFDLAQRGHLVTVRL